MRIKTWGDLQAFAARVALPLTAEIRITGCYSTETDEVDAETDECTVIRCPRPGCTHTHQSLRLTLRTDLGG